MNIIAFLESNGDSFKRTAFEVATAARQIADDFSGKVIGVTVNSTADATSTLGEYGVDSCVNLSGEHFAKHSSSAIAEALSQIANSENGDVVLLPATSHGKEVAPRVAIKLEAGAILDAIALTKDGDSLTVTKPVYAGKALVSATINTAKKVITIRPNVFTATKASAAASTAFSEASVALEAQHVTSVVQSVSKNDGKLDVAEADVIVSGGRGLKSPEDYEKLILPLASKLGAANGASRAIVDAGWRPHSEQVGQTGKTVSPSLYVACGISGAVQHLAGMSSSKVIVAINKDANAPIFTVADYGIVGDVFEVLPQLTEKISAN